MPNISQEKAIERFGSLPGHLKEALFSEKNSELVWSLGETNHLSEAKIKKVADLTGAVILGFIHPEDLQKEIEREIDLPPQITASITQEISRKILEPIMDEVKSLYHWGTPTKSEDPTLAEGSPEIPEGDSLKPPSPPKSAQTQQPETSQQLVQAEEKADLLSPGFKERSTAPQPPPQQSKPAVPTQPAPFVLHKEAKLQSLASTSKVPLSRPQFFKSTAKEKPRAAPSTARLEIGADAAPETQQIGQTKKEIPKVVNYTGPVTKADPFKRPNDKKKKAPQPQKEIPPKEESPPKEVSPENIVNLKDLPK